MRFLIPLLALGLLCGCAEKEEEVSKGLGFEEFVPKYNAYISKWLAKELEEAETALKEAKAKAAAERVVAPEAVPAPETGAAVEDGAGEETAAGDGSDENNEDNAEEAPAGLTEEQIAMNAKLDALVADAQKQVDRLVYRQQLGNYFEFKTPEDLPEGLVWENGMDEPEIGDARAKKGGTFNFYIPNFPPTLRPFGPEANNSFRGEIYDNVEMSMIALHPHTGKVIPALAQKWAITEDNKTVYFKIHPDAKYNDGVPVKARDVLVAIYLRVSDNITAPYPKQYFREQFGQWVVYDDLTLGVTMADAKPRYLAPYYSSMQPAPPHFYDEYGPDYEERYNWKVPPTTGAYYVKDEDIVKGVSITLTRAKDWWAKDMKYYRYMYNSDQIFYRVVRDRAKVWELFRAGEIDCFLITTPQYWYQKSEIPPVFDGYIERYMWYNQFPRPPFGLYLNIAKEPLSDLKVRKGISHAMNWEKVVDVIFWGDYSRLPGFVDGYGDLVNRDVRPRQFSVAEARRYFAEAGYTEEGPDGVLQKPGGQRLQVALTYSTNSPILGNMMAILKDEAKKAGVDLVLDGLEQMVSYKKQMKKEHEIAFGAWNFQPPAPRYYEYFHSRNAYDDKGNLKQQTNNVFSYKNDEMDKLTEGYRNAETWEDKKNLGIRIQQIIHDEALFVPGYSREFERMASWRWMRWPDSEETRFSPKMTSYPWESYTWWIDEEMKEETLKAMRDGKTFPEVERVIDEYRTPAQKGGGGE